MKPVAFELLALLLVSLAAVQAAAAARGRQRGAPWRRLRASLRRGLKLLRRPRGRFTRHRYRSVAPLVVIGGALGLFRANSQMAPLLSAHATTLTAATALDSGRILRLRAPRLRGREYGLRKLVIMGCLAGVTGQVVDALANPTWRFADVSFLSGVPPLGSLRVVTPDLTALARDSETTDQFVRRVFLP